MPFLMEYALRILLLPVLVAQALMLRARALRLPEASGPRTGVQGTGPDLSVLIYGDSSAAGVGVTHQDEALAGQMVATLARTHRVTWRLEAKTGATTRDTLQSLHALPACHFDVAVQALGVNDVTSGKTLRGWLRDQDAIATHLRERHGVRHLWITGVPPMHLFPLLPQPLRWILGRQATRFDLAQRARCNAQTHLTYVPVAVALGVESMAEDGFHPGPQVYAAWGQGTAELIVEALPHMLDSPSGATA